MICTLCKLPVPDKALHLPDRCLDRGCPVNAAALAQRIAEEKAIAARAEAARLGAAA